MAPQRASVIPDTQIKRMKGSVKVGKIWYMHTKSYALERCISTHNNYYLQPKSNQSINRVFQNVREVHSSRWLETKDVRPVPSIQQVRLVVLLLTNVNVNMANFRSSRSKVGNVSDLKTRSLWDLVIRTIALIKFNLFCMPKKNHMNVSTA